MVLHCLLGSGLIALPTSVLEIYLPKPLMLKILIVLKIQLLKAINAFSRFHSAVTPLMLPLLLICQHNKSLLHSFPQLCPAHVQFGMLKKHVMPSHFQGTMFFIKKFLRHPVLLLQGLESRWKEQTPSPLMSFLRYFVCVPCSTNSPSERSFG
uniref:Uncharacterized protein MANES_09G067200 n=1 Tax=Rhizophora mucronata TaxID=61149 RepID=A0A2P2LZH5_RHIMU